MTRRHIFFSSQVSQIKISRSGLAFAILLSAGLACASAVRAQDDAPSASPMAVIAAADDVGLKAYAASLPSAPVPTFEAAASAIVQQQSPTPDSTEHRHTFYWLDRKSLTYGLVQG